jgi:hypothetical protein
MQVIIFKNPERVVKIILMKIITVLLVSLAIISSSYAQGLSLAEIRKQYVQGAENEDTAEKLLKALGAADTPVTLAYKGATQAVMAKYATLPSKKYSLAKKGLAMINSAIAKDPENIEIRYLRFTIQENVPGFLGLSGDMDKDKAVIVRNVSKRKDYQIDDAFLKEMVLFMIDSDECSDEEIEKLKQEAKIK